jgi:hypothetical protein
MFRQKITKPLQKNYSTKFAKLCVGIIPSDKNSNYYLINKKNNEFAIPMSIFSPKDGTPQNLAKSLANHPNITVGLHPLYEFNLDNELETQVHVLIYSATLDETSTLNESSNALVEYENEKSSKFELNYAVNIFELKKLLLEQQIKDPISVSALSPLVIYNEMKSDRESFDSRNLWFSFFLFVGAFLYGFLIRMFSKL